MNLVNVFDEISTQMRSDLDKARAALTHCGLKVAAFEEIFRAFLREYLPKSLDISTGQIIDSSGGISRQLDVIISDALKTPIFYRSGELRVIPVECVYTVIEVKALLDTKEINNILANMESVRALKKSAYILDAGIERGHTMYGKAWDIWPINYYVFAFDSINLVTVAETLIQQTAFFPLERRVDMVCVLGNGVMINQLANGTFNALPEPGSEVKVKLTEKALLLFYTLASRYFFQAAMPMFRFLDYLGSISF